MSERDEPWELVGRSGDPVPGDPAEVVKEASHYTTVAEEIENQVARLKRLADPHETLKGHYAEKLQESCSDLADHLDKMHGRFKTAGEQLNNLHPALETARTKTKTAVDAAVDEKESEEKKADADPDYKPDEKSPWDKSQPEKDCDSAMDSFNDIADEVARKIKNATDDDMKDGRFEGLKSAFKSVVEAVADAVVKILKTISSLIAIALVVLLVVSLFIPGLNILTLVIALSVASLLINTTLALTGNGSWTDVGLDVLGLLTLGMGSGALKLMKVGRMATLSKAAKPLAKAKRMEAFQRAAWNGGKGFRGAVSRLRPSVIQARSAAYADEFARVTSKPLTGAGFTDHLRDLREIRKMYPGVRSSVRHIGGMGAIPAAETGNAAVTVVAGDRGVGTLQELYGGK